jgi:peptide/nickel transport system permease protein
LNAHQNHSWTTRFLRNKLAVAGLGLVLLCAGIGLLGANIRPDTTRHANLMCLPIARQHPGFSCWLFFPEAAPTGGTWWLNLAFGGEDGVGRAEAVSRFEANADSLVLFSRLGRSGEQRLAYAWSTWPETQTAEGRARWMQRHLVKRTFWLGTDRFGRDLLSRLMAGTLVSLSVGSVAVFLSLLIGVVLGALAGYFRGWLDSVISWLFQVVWAIPTLLLVISITLLLGKGFWQVFVAVGCSMWVEVARLVRGQYLSFREQEFVQAARVLGFGHVRIMFRHILPNAMGPVVVMASANFANAILLEAGLSFLGIGAQAPMPTWGGMIKDHYGYITLDAAFLAVLPGAAIMLLVLAFLFVGNGLRDALDTRQAHLSAS